MVDEPSTVRSGVGGMQCIPETPPGYPGTSTDLAITWEIYIASVPYHLGLQNKWWNRTPYNNDLRSASINFRYVPTEVAISLLFGLRISFTEGLSRSKSSYCSLIDTYAEQSNIAWCSSSRTSQNTHSRFSRAIP